MYQNVSLGKINAITVGPHVILGCQDPGQQGEGTSTVPVRSSKCTILAMDGITLASTYFFG
jgi:hypothetical protein